MSTNLSVLSNRNRVTHIRPGCDLDAAAEAAGAFLRCLGFDPNDPSTRDLAETPRSCMTLRGARAVDSATTTATTTSSLRGHLRENAAARTEFLALANGGAL